MRYVYTTMLVLLIAVSSFGQNIPWEHSVYEDPFGSSAEMVFSATKDIMNQCGFAIIRKGASNAAAIHVNYLCDDGNYMDTEIAFKKNGKWVSGELRHWNLYTEKSDDSKMLTLRTFDPEINLYNCISRKFIEHFKASSEMAIKIYNKQCGTEVYKFSLKGSSAALAKLKSLEVCEW